MTDTHIDTRFELDDRQRAILAEMGVRVWMPQSVPKAHLPVAPALVTEPKAERTLKLAPLPKDIALMDWTLLQTTASACQSCGLCEGRQQAILGEGLATADWMVVGDAPGEDEDKSATSFAGPAGELLDNMLRALKLTREQVYLTYAVKCKTPAGRSASQEELLQCGAYLARQVALVQPKVILAMGRTAALALLQSTEPLGKLRSQVQSFQGVPVVVTYPPVYLLRNQADKAKAWADLCLAASLLNA